MIDEATEIISDIGHADLDRGAVKADGSDFQSHAVLLVSEGMFDKRSDL